MATCRALLPVIIPFIQLTSKDVRNMFNVLSGGLLRRKLSLLKIIPIVLVLQEISK